MNRQSSSSLGSQHRWPGTITKRSTYLTFVAMAASVVAGMLLDRALLTRPAAATSPADDTALEYKAHDVEGKARDVARSRTSAHEEAPRVPIAVEPRSTGRPTTHDEALDEDVQAFRVRQSAELLALVQQRLRLAEKSISGRTTEGAVNQLLLYQTGLIDGVIRTAPELAGALSEHIERALCDSSANAATQMSLLRMVAQAPDLASARGFECILDGGRPEDAVLWAGLDALRATGLASPAALERLAGTSRDERTIQRLATLRDADGVSRGPHPSGPADVRRSLREEHFNTGAPLDEEKEEP